MGQKFVTMVTLITIGTVEGGGSRWWRRGGGLVENLGGEGVWGEV